MQNFDHEDFDEDAREQSEAIVINVSDAPIRFEIATQPGTKPRRYKLAPWSRQGDRVSLQVGYTVPFKGAGRGMVRPTIESLTMCEMVSEITPSATHPGRPAVRIPLVVHEDRADAARAKYVAMRDRVKQSGGAMPTILLHTDDGTPMRVQVKRAPSMPIEDVEDQGGPLDDPPPDDDTPPPAEDAAPAIPTVGAPTSSRASRARGGGA